MQAVLVFLQKNYWS